MAHSSMLRVLSRAHLLYSCFVECLGRKPIHRRSAPPLTDELAHHLSPVFVLSTGRCGTKWLSVLLASSHHVFVNHALQPELVRQSKLVYEAVGDAPVELVRAARDDLLSLAHRAGRIYVETNNKITFFAEALTRAYPKSKFVHLYRHPGDVVRSGMRRDWYAGHLADIGRITMRDRDRWAELSRLERIAWLWNETNTYIEQFLSGLEPERHVSVASEQMFSDPAVPLELCEFAGATDISISHVKRMHRRRVNVQITGDFPKYAAWSEEQKQALRLWCPLAPKYGYDLE